MFKRIRKINNIGTFSNFNASPPIQLEKLTFVYGLNTYGKTTLTDIFQSIKKDDFSFLETRKSIPKLTIDQQVELNYKLPNLSQEQGLKVENNEWVNNQLKDNIEIFSTEFIYENLFTGLSVERANKENFTRFILGNSGVELARDIKNKKQILNKLNKELSNKLPDFVKQKNNQEINDFINLDISGFNLEALKTEFSTKQLELAKEKEQLKAPEKILVQPIPCPIDIPSYNLLETIGLINDLLKSDFKNISDEALIKVNAHIESNFKNKEIAENWIKTGKENIKEMNCSFCGQELNNVSDLIDAYNQFFNQEYSSFIEKLEKDYNNHKEIISCIRFTLKNDFNSESLKANTFNEIIEDDTLKEKITELNNQIELLDDEKLNYLLSNSLTEIDVLFNEKRLKPHTRIAPFDITTIQEEFTTYIDGVKSLNEKIQEIIDLINVYKEKYKDIEKLKSEINQKEIDLKKIDYKIKRIEQNSACETYKNSLLNINKLKTEITEKEIELENNQTTYLQDYYSNIDALFKQFGSRNFTLEKHSSTRGFQPVYSLKVKFHNEDINEKDFAKVFSESDKRALALSVFWAKIKMKSDKEKSNTILILDDPVTSFDDNRISKSIDLFKEAINELNQIIILTHYPNFIKRFFEKTHNKFSNIKFLELKKDNQTSKLKECNLDKIIKSDYQRTYEKIIGYINGEHENCIKGDLRKFLESCYIPHFFPHKLIQAKNENVDMSKLSNQIDYIFSGQEEVKNKFHYFRESTNPDAHIFTSNNIEDVKNFAHEMMSYLYTNN